MKPMTTDMKSQIRAELQGAMADAHKALRVAFADARYSAVKKYAAELESLQARMARELGERLTISPDGMTTFCDKI